MKMETYEKHFKELVALINKNNNVAAFESDVNVRNAFDDLSQTLGLTHEAVASLVWVLNNMNEDVVDLSYVASQIDYSEDAVSSSIDELERRGYLVYVDEYTDNLDVTAKTKELMINHYCFRKLLNN